MAPFTLATWRCAVGSLAILPLLRGIPRPKKEKWLNYVIVGLFQTTGMFGFMLHGMKFVTAGKTSVLLYTMPLWTCLLAHFYLKERLTPSRWLGVFSGAIGIVCILGWDTLVNQNVQILFGEFLVIAGSFSWAVANILAKKQMTGENAYMVNGLQMAIGTLGLALLSVPTEGLWRINWTWVSIGVILFTGVVASTVNFTIWFHLLKKLDTHTVASSSMLVPVFGLLFDRLQLGKTLDTDVIVGGVFILAGIYQVSKRQKSDKTDKDYDRHKEAALK